MESEVYLPLEDLAERHPGLTPAAAEFLHEAARVCLERHHTSPTRVEIVDAERRNSATVEWSACSERVRAAHANEIDTTENGAYAFALATAELTRGLFAMGRAETLTGADYYLAPAGVELGDFERCIRLEVSGTDKGDVGDINTRLAAKLSQAKAGESDLPALAAVVGFRLRQVVVKEVA